MNIKDNKRKKQSQEKIEKTFVELLQTKEVKDISISDICKISKLNRSTFYANYIDIYDLVDKLQTRMINEFLNVYSEESKTETHSYNFLKLFQDIKDNQIFYKTYFKLNFDFSSTFIDKVTDEEMIKFFGTSENKEYHIAFFKAGLNAIIKKWLNNNCVESPEEMNKIIVDEYNKRIDCI